MITKMKKLTFLVYHKEYEAFLAQIRELGVVHVVERQCGEMDDTLQQFMQKRTLYKNMLQSMHTLADKQPEEKVHKELSADALVKFYEDLQARIQDLNQQIPAIDKDVAQMEVWGDFDWRAIRKLEDAGWFVHSDSFNNSIVLSYPNISGRFPPTSGDKDNLPSENAPAPANPVEIGRASCRERV